MSQRVRRNVSPTTSITAASSGGGGSGGAGASGTNAGLSSFGRLLPMKATVPFQLKLQSQPPLQTRSPHGTSSGGNSPTRSSSSNNSSSSKGSASGCEATGTRTSTSSSRSPTRAVSASASAVISPLAPSSVSPPFSSSHASPAAAVGTQTGSASSPSSGGNPAVTTHVSASGTSGATGRPPQPPPQAPSQQQLTVSASHGNIHNSGNSNVITSLSAPPFSVSARSPCSSPTQPLLWLSDCSLVATSLQTPHFSASPSSSSSSSSSSSGGNRERPQPPPQRSSPEHGRQSPERRSPSSPIFREKLRPAPAIAPSGSSSCASSTSCSSGSGVHHSPSLDTLTGPYLSGHWPRDGCHAQCAPCMRDKATQTPSAWADECSEKRRSSHKRSASWGSTDQLKEIAKLRQQLQRSKHSSRHHRDKERKSPFNGNHAAVSQSQAPIPKSVLIPIPISKPVSRFRNSLEGLNQEIERIIVREPGERDEQLLPQDVPDGHRAPPPLPQRSSSTRSIDTQTPSGGGGGGGGTGGGGGGGTGGRGSNHSDSSSRSQSVSPTFLTVTSDAGAGSPCPYDDLLSKDLGTGSPLPKYASSPKPNNSYMFKREPPEGCERVKVFEETTTRPLQEVPQFLCPDRNKVNFIPKSGSAFCLVSILKPLLPTPERPLKGSGGMAVRSLSPSLALEQEQRVVTRGTSTTNQQPSLPRHLEEPES